MTNHSEIIEKWTNIALSTDPCDRAKAEDVVSLLYQREELARPLFEWCCYTEEADQKSTQLIAEMMSCTPEEVLSGKTETNGLIQIDVRFSENILSSLSRQYSLGYDTLSYREYRDQINSISDLFIRVANGRSRVNCIPDIYDAIYCEMNISDGKVKRDDISDLVIALAENVLAFKAYHGICYMVDRPEVIRVDDRLRFHCEDGPAVRFRDGTELYRFNGIGMKKEHIMQPVTKQMILEAENVEQRRILVGRVGIEGFIEIMQCDIVDEDVDKFGNNRRLYATDHDIGRRDFKIAQYIDPSTGRIYTTYVPSIIKSIEQAMNFINGFRIDAELDIDIES